MSIVNLFAFQLQVNMSYALICTSICTSIGVCHFYQVFVVICFLLVLIVFRIALQSSVIIIHALTYHFLSSVLKLSKFIQSTAKFPEGYVPSGVGW